MKTFFSILLLSCFMIACSSETANTSNTNTANTNNNTSQLTNADNKGDTNAPQDPTNNSGEETNTSAPNAEQNKAEDSEAIYYMNMEFDEFWETFQGAVQRKDFEVMKKLSKFDQQSLLGEKEMVDQYDILFDKAALKILANTKSEDIKETEAPTGKMAKTLNILSKAGEGEAGEGSATMMYFEKTDMGWKLTMIFIAG